MAEEQTNLNWTVAFAGSAVGAAVVGVFASVAKSMTRIMECTSASTHRYCGEVSYWDVDLSNYAAGACVLTGWGLSASVGGWRMLHAEDEAAVPLVLVAVGVVCSCIALYLWYVLATKVFVSP